MNPVFVDTNILIYARDRNQPDKRLVAERWLDSLARNRTGRISWQVLAEFYSAATHPRKLALGQDLARSDIEALSVWNPPAHDIQLFRSAWMVRDRHDFSWWDALIVAAALRQRCATLLSEDMQDGMQVEDTARDGLLTIINPFAPGAPQPA